MSLARLSVTKWSLTLTDSHSTRLSTTSRGGTWPISSVPSEEMMAAPCARAKSRKTCGSSNSPWQTLSRSAMVESICTMDWRSASRRSDSAWVSAASICSDSTRPNSSQAVRVWKDTRWG